MFTITVDDPQRVGDPIRGYTLYTVHTRVNLFYLTAMRMYSHEFISDNFATLFQILILSPPEILRLPMVVRNALY